MAGKRITIELQGALLDEGSVRLDMLLKKLREVMDALTQTERLVTGKAKRGLYYRVVDMSHNSPYRIVLEPAMAPEKKTKRKKSKPKLDYSEKTVSAFFTNIDSILNKQEIPKGVDIEALESYEKLSDNVGEFLPTLNIKNGEHSVQIQAGFADKINDLLGVTELVWGSCSGRLQRLDIHNRREFAIFPLAGATRIKCTFGNDLKQKVFDAVDQHVRVYGELVYRGSSYFPASVRVSEIEELAHPDRLPKLSDLRGSIPGLTEGKMSEDFVRTIRGGE